MTNKENQVLNEILFILKKIEENTSSKGVITNSSIAESRSDVDEIKRVNDILNKKTFFEIWKEKILSFWEKYNPIAFFKDYKMLNSIKKLTNKVVNDDKIYLIHKRAIGSNKALCEADNAALILTGTDAGVTCYDCLQVGNKINEK